MVPDLADGPVDPDRTPAPDAVSLRSVGRSAVVLALGTLVAQVVIMVRELFLAAQVGASSQSDALLVGIALPAALGSMLTSGAMVALVPAYLSARSGSGAHHARRFAGSVVTWTALTSLALMAILEVAAPTIVSITASGLSDTSQAEAAGYMRIAAPALVAIAVHGVLLSICQAEGLFKWMAASTVVVSVGSVAVMLVLWPGLHLAAYAVGSLVGPYVGLLLVGGVLMRRGLGPRPTLRLRGLGLRAFAHHTLPLTMSSSILQLNAIADTAVASHLAPGGVSALRFGQLLVNVPIGAVGMAWSRSIYPALVHSSLDRRGSGLSSTATLVMRYVFAVFVPVALLFAAVAPLMVSVVYGRGAFTGASAQLTSMVVLGLAPLIVVSMASPVLTGSLNARRMGQVLLMGGIINVTLNFLLDVALGATLGIIGIALSSSIAVITVRVFFARRLARLEPDFKLMPITRHLGRTVIAAVPGAVVIGLLVWSAPTVEQGLVALVLLAMLGLLGGAVYLLFARVIGIRESGGLVILILGRLRLRRFLPGGRA